MCGFADDSELEHYCELVLWNAESDRCHISNVISSMAKGKIASSLDGITIDSLNSQESVVSYERKLIRKMTLRHYPVFA